MYRFNNTVTLDDIELLIRKSEGVATRCPLLIDMSSVEWIDVAAILLLLVWLRMQQNDRIKIKLRLPDKRTRRRTRDFLKKWNFQRALQIAIKTDIECVLDPDQYDYFDDELEYYTDKAISEEYGPLSILKSKNLLEIVPLTKLNPDGNEAVSKEIINTIADDLALRSVVPVIQSAVDCTEEWAKKFGSVLVYQALLNTFEHPDANMVFISMARKPNPPPTPGGRLVIAVADNGDTISKTIADAFSKDNRTLAHRPKADAYKLHTNRIVCATWRETSRKPPVSIMERKAGERVGMGLYYLKNLACQVGGDVIIRCENSSVKFRGEEAIAAGKESPDPREVWHLTRGNIVRISIPLAC